MKRQLAPAAIALVIMMGACGENDPTPPDTTPPGRVTDLSIKSVRTNVITLRWTTPGDNGLQGVAQSYQVRWSPNIITESNFESANMIQDPPAPKDPGTVELFSVPNMDVSEVIHFALRTYDEAGFISEISNDCLYNPGDLPVQFITEVAPLKDNTMYAEADSLSNGAGQYFFAGRPTPVSPERRALLAFAIIDSVPAGAQIDSVRLTMHVSEAPSGARGVQLRALSADWGEGASNAPGTEENGVQALTGDATWGFRFFDTDAWNTPGGDFSEVSAQTTVVGPGFYSWSSDPMKLDVQHWLDEPDSSFGWLVTADIPGQNTLKRFDSRDHPSSTFHPRLKIYYTVIP